MSTLLGPNRFVGYKRRKMSQKFRKKQKMSSFNSRVKRIINNSAESKFINTAISTVAPIAGTSTVQNITLIAQGLTEITREGDQIKIVRIQMRGRIIADGASEDQPTWARILIVRQKDNAGSSPPVIETVLQGDELKAFKLMDEIRSSSFETVYDKSFTINPAGGPIADGKTAQVQLYFSKTYKNGKKTTYDGTAASQASSGRGSYYIYLMTASGVADAPRFDLQIRFTFKDF